MHRFTVVRGGTMLYPVEAETGMDACYLVAEKVTGSIQGFTESYYQKYCSISNGTDTFVSLYRPTLKGQ